MDGKTQRQDKGSTPSLEHLDIQRIDVGGATFSHAVADERPIPFGAFGTLGRHPPHRHLCGFLVTGIELGDLLARFEEEPRQDKPSGVNHDEETRRFSMRSLRMHPR